MIDVSLGEVKLVVDRIDEKRTLARTQRDLIVSRVMMFGQMETAALQHITPKKLKVSTAKDLAVIGAMYADKQTAAHKQLMDYDALHPDERSEKVDPMEKLKRINKPQVIDVESEEDLGGVDEDE